MDEKMFDLLEKMYIEVQDIKSNMACKKDLDNVHDELKHNMVQMENKMDENNKALYDGYKLSYEKLESLKRKVNKVDKNVREQDLEIKVIKGGVNL